MMNSWYLSNPHTCSRCGGRTRLIEQGAIMSDAPSVLRMKVDDTEFDWDEFDRQWREFNATEG